MGTPTTATAPLKLMQFVSMIAAVPLPQWGGFVSGNRTEKYSKYGCKSFPKADKQTRSDA